MTVTEALEKLKTYEQTSFALGHAMGLLYYDGVTVAPKGAAAVRGDTSAELSRIDYQLTTAPETVEMLETLMAAREELDAVTRRKVEEYWRSYDRTRRIPEEEFVAYQRLSIKADDVWQTAKETNDFAPVRAVSAGDVRHPEALRPVLGAGQGSLRDDAGQL